MYLPAVTSHVAARSPTQGTLITTWPFPKSSLIDGAPCESPEYKDCRLLHQLNLAFLEPDIFSIDLVWYGRFIIRGDDADLPCAIALEDFNFITQRRSGLLSVGSVKARTDVIELVGPMVLVNTDDC